MNGFFVSPDSYVLTRWLFLRLLGLIYLIAFTSFGVQLTGLIGEKGILPARLFLERVHLALGRKGYLACPTLAWFNGSDRFLVGLCVMGSILALLLVSGFQATWLLLLLWAGYLSLVVIAQVFLSFQWDVLLVEAGFLAVFLIPPSLLPAQSQSPPSPFIIFLFVWLLFRLIFQSGVLKLASGDPTWRNLTAMAYHYETQPLPTPLAWYAHKAPPGFQKVSTFLTLVLEIIIPLLFFLPDPLRQAGAVLTILLQVLILLTGNFAFFNWLTIALTVFLFHDSQLQALLPGLADRLPGYPPAGPPAWGVVLPVILTVFYLAFGMVFLFMRFLRGSAILNRLAPVIQVVQDFRLVNSYGLFTVMTTVHPEIVMEGSLDGQTWQAYAFKYKIDNPLHPLPLVAPHQPRLDWQMWFAALSTYSEVPWFLHFAERLLEGSPAVLGLLRGNPFPDQPPKYIRAVLYDYKFSTFTERRASGARWKREMLGLYLPPVSMKQET